MASVLDVTLKRGQNMNLNYNKMNALKFQNIREKRQECFNVDEYTFNDFDFEMILILTGKGVRYIQMST